MANFNDRHIFSLLNSTLKQSQTHIIQDPQQGDRARKMLAQLDRGILQEKLAQLDLNALATPLTASSGGGWSDRQVHLAIARYLLFLFLTYLHPSQILVPSKEVDLVWHEHLLQDTRKYARDCQMLFEGFVHHAHTSQLWDNGQDEQARIAYQQTRSLMRRYLQHSEDNLAKELLVRETPENGENGACGHPI